MRSIGYFGNAQDDGRYYTHKKQYKGPLSPRFHLPTFRSFPKGILLYPDTSPILPRYVVSICWFSCRIVRSFVRSEGIRAFSFSRPRTTSSPVRATVRRAVGPMRSVNSIRPVHSVRAVHSVRPVRPVDTRVVSTSSAFFGSVR